ncbi:hypothetical protein E2C01_096800 [Portunus trituberculatus]|uniref:Uncharacterized protein n=1 Tax=Portunus trituberculatus TaxID=210409 RepID=A0A5B7JWK0_PORTR|nr:hypothetical protein [Portunus trituberculatus]
MHTTLEPSTQKHWPLASLSAFPFRPSTAATTIVLDIAAVVSANCEGKAKVACVENSPSWSPVRPIQSPSRLRSGYQEECCTQPLFSMFPEKYCVSGGANSPSPTSLFDI